uniref:Uncharacterized protein n=1 Tax=Lygus hesperus TaxID=30085 RepID=A0A0A9X217_LYGHE
MPASSSHDDDKQQTAPSVAFPPTSLVPLNVVTDHVKERKMNATGNDVGDDVSNNINETKDNIVDATAHIVITDHKTELNTSASSSTCVYSASANNNINDLIIVVNGGGNQVYEDDEDDDIEFYGNTFFAKNGPLIDDDDDVVDTESGVIVE